MALIITGFAGVFSDAGIATAIVQRQQATERFLSSLFWANVSAGVALSVVLFATSSLAGAFFHEPRVGIVIQALAPTFLIANLSTVQRSLLQRDMLFNDLAKIELWASVAACGVAILAAMRGFGVWSIVCQQYVITAIQTIMLWRFSAWKPTVNFAWEELRSVMGFSANLTAYGVLNYWARNADNALIGRYLGPTNLGYYGMAYRLMQYPVTAVSSLVSRVLLPSFSRLQGNESAVRQAYLQSIGFISFITFPIMFGLLALAGPVVELLFSKKWLPVVVPLMIFALVGANQSLSTTTGNLYTAKGRTDLMFRVGFVNCSLYLVGIIAGLPWGVIGVALGYAVADAIATPIDYHFALPLIGLCPWRIWKPMSGPLIASVLMAAMLYLISPPLYLALGLRVGLAASVFSGATAYLVWNWVVNRGQLLALLELSRQLRGAQAQ